MMGRPIRCTRRSTACCTTRHRTGSLLADEPEQDSTFHNRDATQSPFSVQDAWLGFRTFPLVVLWMCASGLCVRLMLGKMQEKELAPEKRTERGSRRTYLSLGTHYSALAIRRLLRCRSASYAALLRKMSICEPCEPSLPKKGHAR